MDTRFDAPALAPALGFALGLGLALAVGVGSTRAVAQERGGGDALRDAEVARLVWAAADVPEARFEGALRELVGCPGVTWREVCDVLAAGRDYAERPALREVVGIEEFARHREHFEEFRWERGVVRRYAIADEDVPYWYEFRLPAEYDGRTAVPVVLDFHVLGESAPPGWAVVRLNPNIGAAPTLGGARISMTAGVAAQSIVLSVIADLERRFHVDRDRVFVAGYSRFGNTTWYLGAHWPDLWAGVVPASGYYQIPEALWGNFRNVAVLAAHGDDKQHRDSNQYTKLLGKRLAQRRIADATVLGVSGRAVGPEFAPAAWGWMAEKRRDPLPEHVTYALHDPNHRGAYWVEIEEVRETGGRHTVVIGSPRDPDAERIYIHRKLASADVRVTAPNEVTISTRNVARLRLRLSPEMFDLSQPIVVRAGAKTTKHTPRPSVRKVLEGFREERDRRRLFPDDVVLDL